MQLNLQRNETENFSDFKKLENSSGIFEFLKINWWQHYIIPKTDPNNPNLPERSKPNFFPVFPLYFADFVDWNFSKFYTK